MTVNQQAYKTLEENERHNRAMEAENFRHNKATEDLSLSQLNEQIRHSVITELNESYKNAQLAKHYQASDEISSRQQSELTRSHLESERQGRDTISLSSLATHSKARNDTRNATTNEYNADTRRMEAETNAFNAETRYKEYRANAIIGAVNAASRAVQVISPAGTLMSLLK